MDEPTTLSDDEISRSEDEESTPVTADTDGDDTTDTTDGDSTDSDADDSDSDDV